MKFKEENHAPAMRQVSVEGMDRAADVSLAKFYELLLMSGILLVSRYDVLPWEELRHHSMIKDLPDEGVSGFPVALLEAISSPLYVEFSCSLFFLLPSGMDAESGSSGLLDWGS